MKDETLPHSMGMPAWQLGTHEGRVVIGDGNGHVVAAFSAPQAALLAALLIKHACSIAAGGESKVVSRAVRDIFGEGKDPPHLHD